MNPLEHAGLGELVEVAADRDLGRAQLIGELCDVNPAVAAQAVDDPGLSGRCIHGNYRT